MTALEKSRPNDAVQVRQRPLSNLAARHVFHLRGGGGGEGFSFDIDINIRCDTRSEIHRFFVRMRLVLGGWGGGVD